MKKLTIPVLTFVDTVCFIYKFAQNWSPKNVFEKCVSKNEIHNLSLKKVYIPRSPPSELDGQSL